MARIVLDPRKLPKGKTDWDALRRKTDKEVIAAARADPDAKPLTPSQIERLLPVVDVKTLRKKLGMTQVAFCKTFKLSPGTVRDWEQYRFVPEGPARVLLTVIDRDPQAIIRALGGTEAPGIAGQRGGSSKKEKLRKTVAEKYRGKSAAA